jgi:hypothetical protein
VREGLRPGVVVLSAGLLSPASGPAAAFPKHPIRDSIEHAVERVLAAHLRPCSQEEQQGMPCFPSRVEAQGSRLSVADSIRSFRSDGSSSPGRPPTVAEMAPYRSGGPQSATAQVPVGDPVCAVKSLWKKIKGEGGPYYLYRTWDTQGEQPLLTDHEIEPADFAGRPDFNYAFVGKFGTECAAITAWRKALRDVAAPPPP